MARSRGPAATINRREEVADASTLRQGEAEKRTAPAGNWFCHGLAISAGSQTGLRPPRGLPQGRRDRSGSWDAETPFPGPETTHPIPHPLYLPAEPTAGGSRFLKAVHPRCPRDRPQSLYRASPIGRKIHSKTIRCERSAPGASAGLGLRRVARPFRTQAPHDGVCGAPLTVVEVNDRNERLKIAIVPAAGCLTGTDCSESVGAVSGCQEMPFLQEEFLPVSPPNGDRSLSLEVRLGRSFRELIRRPLTIHVSAEPKCQELPFRPKETAHSALVKEASYDEPNFPRGHFDSEG